MDENKLLDALKQDAEKIQVPEALSPEHIQDKLDVKPKASKMTKIFGYGGLVAAAALVVVVLGVVVPRIGGKNSSMNTDVANAKTSDSTMASSAADEAAETTTAQSLELDTLLTAATDYEEVYNKVTTIYESYNSMAKSDDIMVESSAADAGMTSGTTEEAVAADSAVAYGGSGSGESYSETNVQEAGVDEGDVVKTDGSYIYIMNESSGVRIVKANGADMQEMAVIDPKDNPSDSLQAMYVDGDTLVLVVHRLSTDLLQQELGVYSIDNQEQTCVVTYDISDRKNPVKSGEVSQDGYYQTSRKVGNYFYLFTEYGTPNPCLRSDGTWDDAVPYSEATLSEGYIPKVNSENIAADSIFLPDNANSGTYLIISSINLDKPDKVVNSKAVLSISNQFYVSQTSIYIDAWEWTQNSSGTSIVKIDFKDGEITPKAASSVPGNINDNFSMNEYNGYLRVVTTKWNSENNTSGLYIFDENMQLTGKVDNLAPGEQIQSARFMGDKGYFVTYKNMDPLFCVDLSDVSNPVILDELKITGFSQYLHFYGENKLLGIGYETDPDTLMSEGLKLSMFDISNAANLTEAKKTVLQGVDGCQALDDYKSLMIDTNENILGFMAYDWDTDNAYTYMIFSYDPNQGFVNEFTQAVTTDMFQNGVYNVRGVFIGETFYLVGYDHIYAYDRTNNYASVGIFG